MLSAVNSRIKKDKKKDKKVSVLKIEDDDDDEPVHASADLFLENSRRMPTANAEGPDRIGVRHRR